MTWRVYAVGCTLPYFIEQGRVHNESDALLHEEIDGEQEEEVKKLFKFEHSSCTRKCNIHEAICNDCIADMPQL